MLQHPLRQPCPSPCSCLGLGSKADADRRERGQTSILKIPEPFFYLKRLPQCEVPGIRNGKRKGKGKGEGELGVLSFQHGHGCGGVALVQFHPSIVGDPVLPSSE